MKVLFNHIVKYNGIFRAPHTPFEADDSDYDMLVKEGAVILEGPKQCEEPVNSLIKDEQENEDEQNNKGEQGTKGEDNSPKVPDLYNMKISELRAYAKELNINLAGLERKADIIEAIKEGLMSGN